MNNQIFFFFYNFAHQSQITDKIIIFFAIYFPYVVALAAVIFLFFYRKSLRELLIVFFSAISAYLFQEILKTLFKFPRPFEVLPNVHSLFMKTDYAFPSGHATFYMALAVSIFFYHKKAGYIFMFFAFLIGIARITSGVHFPGDILAGFALGTLISYFVAFIVKNV